MSFRYKITMLIVGLVVSLPLASIAAGEGPGDDIPKKKKTQEDSLGIFESENKIIDEIVFPDIQKMTPTVYPAKTKASTKKITKTNSEKEVITEENDNSAMSFNFIYYIIDTFKFTDPLE